MFEFLVPPNRDQLSCRRGAMAILYPCTQRVNFRALIVKVLLCDAANIFASLLHSQYTMRIVSRVIHHANLAVPRKFVWRFSYREPLCQGKIEAKLFVKSNNGHARGPARSGGLQNWPRQRFTSGFSKRSSPGRLSAPQSPRSRASLYDWP